MKQSPRPRVGHSMSSFDRAAVTGGRFPRGMTPQWEMNRLPRLEGKRGFGGGKKQNRVPHTWPTGDTKRLALDAPFPLEDAVGLQGLTRPSPIFATLTAETEG